MGQQAFASFSGGKDCHFSIFEAKKRGFEIKYLLNMIEEDGQFSRSHHLPASLLREQANCLGIDIIQKRTTWNNYENNFKQTLLDLKQKNIFTGVFGDVDLEEHRVWIERISKETGIHPVLPLWGKDHLQIAREIIKSGFVAYLIVVNDKFLPPEYLGKKFDQKLVDRLISQGIDPLAEEGEFHTLVTDGPLYTKPLQFTWRKIIAQDGYHFLQVQSKKE